MVAALNVSPAPVESTTHATCPLGSVPKTWSQPGVWAVSMLHARLRQKNLQTRHADGMQRRKEQLRPRRVD